MFRQITDSQRCNRVLRSCSLSFPSSLRTMRTCLSQPNPFIAVGPFSQFSAKLYQTGEFRSLIAQWNRFEQRCLITINLYSVRLRSIILHRGNHENEDLRGDPGSNKNLWSRFQFKTANTPPGYECFACRQWRWLWRRGWLCIIIY